MIEQIIYFSPLMILFFGILVFLMKSRRDTLSYTCFYWAKILLIISFAMSTIFFNKPVIPRITFGNHFTFLSISIMYIGALLLMFFSRKWFVSMKMPANGFCIGVFTALLSGILLITSVHLLLTAICLVILIINNIFLLKKTQIKYQIEEKIHLCIALFGVGAVLFSIFQLYNPNNSFFYDDLRVYIEEHGNQAIVFMAVSLLVLTFLLLIGIAPLHFGLTELLSSTGLPTFTYFMFVPTAACLAGLIQLNIYVLVPILNKLQLFYTNIGLLSIGVGAVGACSGQNIRKIISYTTVYNLGVILLILQRFSLGSTISSYIYYIVFLLAMYGVCASLFGLKVKGEYLFMLHDFNGAASRRPYISAMFAIFLLSFLGFPPLLGFLGSFSLFTDLVSHEHYYAVIYIFVMMLLLSYAYLSIIRALYFENSKELFDRADKGIYVFIMLDAVIMIILLLKPHYLLGNLNVMLGDLFV